jgi:hypothetical protein
MIVRSLIAASLVMFAASSAQASEWWLLGSSGTPIFALVYIDHASIKMIDGYPSAWEKDYIRAPVQNVAVLATLYQFDCANARFRGLSQSSYDANEQEVSAETLHQGWIYPVPDTSGEVSFNFVCGKPNKAAKVPAGSTPSSISKTTFADFGKVPK